MNRREFIKLLGASASVAAMPTISWASTPTNPQYFFLIHAGGGWDVTSYCDPKENTVGAKEITTWSRTQSTQQVGNIRYAPFANNQAFFEKHYQKMCVVNGIDVKTTNHAGGHLVSMTGKFVESHPSITALFAASQAEQPLLSYLSASNFGNSMGIVPVTELSSAFKNNLQRAANPQLNPNQTRGDRHSYKLITDHELELIKQARIKRLQSLANKVGNLNQDQVLIDRMLNFETTSSSFSDFYTTYSNLESPPHNADTVNIILSAFATNQTNAADFTFGSFDTHTDHDAGHDRQLSRLNDVIDYIWYASELLNIHDKLTIVLTSEFSRTPYYNKDNGKDHWNVGSSIFMRHAPSWGNKVVGSTDEFHNLHKFNLSTMERDEINGQNLTIEHIHMAYRDLLGLNGNAYADLFNFGDAEVPRIFT
jgi:hypothetical protein